VTIPKSGPLYFKTDPVTFETLQQRLKQAVGSNPHIKAAISADTDAPFGLIVKVLDATKEAKFLPENVSFSVKPADKQP